MSQSIKIRAKEKKGVVVVKALMRHPMETGLRKDSKTGSLIPAHFIEELVCEANGQQVIKALWSGGVSANPYISFEYKGGKGDRLKLSWLDNTGKSESATVDVR